MTQLRFADISSHNAVINWSTFLGSLDGLIVKISEGIGYAWSGAPNALAQARNAGKLVGVYHFARVNDPVQEANYFLAHYTHQPGEVIVLDWEPGMGVGDGDAWAFAWCSRVIAATGVVPWLYLNHYYASVQSQWVRTRSLGCGLWAAWYGANTGQPQPGMPPFTGWPSAAAWQYTSAGSVPGHSGSVDLNYFYGDATAWRAYGNPGGAPDMPLTAQDLAAIYQAVWFGVPGAQLIEDRRTPGKGEWPEAALGSVAARIRDELLPPERAAVANQVWWQTFVSRGTPDGGTTQTPALQELANTNTNALGIVQKLTTQDPQALADAVVAAMGSEFAQKVIDALGQRINQTQPPAAS